MASRASNVIIIHVVAMTLSVVLTYATAVGFGHVDPFLPNFGYIGDRPLESTMFTQFFVINAIVLMFLTQIRYVYVCFLTKSGAPLSVLRANTASVCLGYIAASGLFVLACFQESNAFYVHHIAEFVYLFGSVAYFCLQTFITKSQNSLRVKIRILLCTLMIAFSLGFIGVYLAAISQFKKPWESRFHWQEDDGGWVLHILSAVFEWLLIFWFQCYLLTFYIDFYRVMLTKTRIVVLAEEGRSH